jgi:hypothetical protein
MYMYSTCTHLFASVLPSIFSGEIFMLVSWPEGEHDVSVISNVHHPIQAGIVVGEICDVAFGKRTFPATVHATGTQHVQCHVYRHGHVCVCVCVCLALEGIQILHMQYVFFAL